jgi:ribosomal protein S18 acetylase RimI-like enzyme
MSERPAYVVRDAVPADVPSLILMKCKLATSEGTENTVRADERDWQQQCFGPQPRVAALIAEQDGVAVGMITFSEHPYAGWSEPAIRVDDIFVDVPYRRRGIARALLGAVASRAHALRSPMIELSVRDDNPARKLYRACGFERVLHCMTYVAGQAAITQLLGAEPTAAT